MAHFDVERNNELDHCYVDVDGIRLVYECVNGVSIPQLVGWYRPDAWGKPAPVENGYAVMVGGMLE